MLQLLQYQKIKALIFDLDGVLVDSRHLHFEALNRALNEIDPKYVISVEEHLAKYDGLPTSKKLALLTEEKGLPKGFHSDVWRRKQDMTIDLISELIKPCPKLINMLSKLHKDGYKLYCCSNSISITLVEMLKALGIYDFFDRIYSNEDVSCSKPHPMIYMKCCCDNGLIPCQTLVIEDSPIGRVAATLSGCHVCPVACPDGVQLHVIKDYINMAETKNSGLKIDTRWQSDVQVVIPMAGLGSRFMVAGYKDPKPLIKIGKVGEEKPMIAWVVNNMNICGAQFIFIVRKEHLENTEWNIQGALEEYAPGCKIVVTDKLTDGPACSVLLAWEAGVLDADKPLLIANSDQFLEWDPNSFLYQSQGCDGAISVFHQPNKDDKKWSYVSLDEMGFVNCVKEKEVISDLASTGVYYWSHVRDFVKYTMEMIDANERVNNEFYVAPVYNKAVADGKKIKVIKCNKMWGLGVPLDLDEFKRGYLRL